MGVVGDMEHEAPGIAIAAAPLRCCEARCDLGATLCG